MRAIDIAQLAFYVAMLPLLAWPLEAYMAAVYDGRRTALTRAIAPVERAVYRLRGIDRNAESGCMRYSGQILICNLGGVVLVYLLQRLQRSLPLNSRR